MGSETVVQESKQGTMGRETWSLTSSWQTASLPRLWLLGAKQCFMLGGFSLAWFPHLFCHSSVSLCRGVCVAVVMFRTFQPLRQAFPDKALA